MLYQSLWMFSPWHFQFKLMVLNCAMLCESLQTSTVFSRALSSLGFGTYAAISTGTIVLRLIEKKGWEKRWNPLAPVTAPRRS